MFSRSCGRFSGRSERPGGRRRQDPAKRAPSSPRAPGLGVTGRSPTGATACKLRRSTRRNPGRGFHVFKALRPIFRAIGPARRASAPGPGKARAVIPRAPGLGVTGRSPTGATACKLRRSTRRNPGRGFNVFKALRPVFRAIATPSRAEPRRSPLRRREPESFGSTAKSGRGFNVSKALRRFSGRSQRPAGVGAGAIPDAGRRPASFGDRPGEIPGADFMFSRPCGRFSGRSDRPGGRRRQDPATRTPSSARAPGLGVTGRSPTGATACKLRRSTRRNPGRGFHVFKALRPIFRAIATDRTHEESACRTACALDHARMVPGPGAARARPDRAATRPARFGDRSGEIPGADSMFSRPCGRFSGRSQRPGGRRRQGPVNARAVIPTGARPRRYGAIPDRGDGLHASAIDPAKSRARISCFQGLAADFPGDRNGQAGARRRAPAVIPTAPGLGVAERTTGARPTPRPSIRNPGRAICKFQGDGGFSGRSRNCRGSSRSCVNPRRRCGPRASKTRVSRRLWRMTEGNRARTRRLSLRAPRDDGPGAPGLGVTACRRFVLCVSQSRARGCGGPRARGGFAPTRQDVRAATPGPGRAAKTAAVLPIVLPPFIALAGPMRASEIALAYGARFRPEIRAYRECWPMYMFCSERASAGSRYGPAVLEIGERGRAPLMMLTWRVAPRNGRQSARRQPMSDPNDPLARFAERLSLPLIAAPMFLVSGVDLVVAASGHGVIGSFPTANCRNADELELVAHRDGRAPAAPRRRNRRRLRADLSEPDRAPLERPPSRRSADRAQARSGTGHHQRGLAGPRPCPASRRRGVGVRRRREHPSRRARGRGRGGRAGALDGWRRRPDRLAEPIRVHPRGPTVFLRPDRPCRRRQRWSWHCASHGRWAAIWPTWAPGSSPRARAWPTHVTRTCWWRAAPTTFSSRAPSRDCRPIC